MSNMSKALAHMKVCFQNKGLHRIWTAIRKLQLCACKCIHHQDWQM